MVRTKRIIFSDWTPKEKSNPSNGVRKIQFVMIPSAATLLPLLLPPLLPLLALALAPQVSGDGFNAIELARAVEVHLSFFADLATPMHVCALKDGGSDPSASKAAVRSQPPSVAKVCEKTRSSEPCATKPPTWGDRE